MSLLELTYNLFYPIVSNKEINNVTIYYFFCLSKSIIICIFSKDIILETAAFTVTLSLNILFIQRIEISICMPNVCCAKDISILFFVILCTIRTIRIISSAVI